MSTKGSKKDMLLQKIEAKRQEIQSYISKTKPRKRRLANTAIVCSAIATALTAGPAFGGKTFSDWLTETLSLVSPVWQLLCLGAVIFSVAAAIVTNLSKSQDIVSKLQNAQSTDAKLEGLSTLIEMDQVDVDEASSHYVQYLNDIPFL